MVAEQLTLIENTLISSVFGSAWLYFVFLGVIVVIIMIASRVPLEIAFLVPIPLLFVVFPGLVEVFIVIIGVLLAVILLRLFFSGG